MPSQSAPTILDVKIWVGLGSDPEKDRFRNMPCKKTKWIKEGQDFFFLIQKEKRQPLLNFKLQAEKIWSRT